MKKVLFHSLTIPPDNVSTGMLVGEIAAGFKKQNVEVEVLASTPQYNVLNNEFTTITKINKNYSESEYISSSRAGTACAAQTPYRRVDADYRRDREASS